MIDRIRGTLLAAEAHTQPAAVVIETLGGVGLRVAVSPGTAERLGSPGEEVVLLTTFLLTGSQDPQPRLFGFESGEARSLFDLLRGVSGVGPNTALRVLSAQPTPADVAAAIAQGDVAGLKVKGVGPKTAKRIITELKEKVGAVLDCLPTAAVAGGAKRAAPAAPLASADQAVKDAFLALQGLEFDPQRARQLLHQIRQEQADATAEELIREVLIRT